MALDIYNITRGKVRFPAEKDGYVTPAKDGAYICMRIADEFDLAAGDTLKISPYGSDKTYKLKVAGVIRSVSENIDYILGLRKVARYSLQNRFGIYRH